MIFLDRSKKSKRELGRKVCRIELIACAALLMYRSPISLDFPQANLIEATRGESRPQFLLNYSQVISAIPENPSECCPIKLVPMPIYESSTTIAASNQGLIYYRYHGLPDEYFLGVKLGNQLTFINFEWGKMGKGFSLPALLLIACYYKIFLKIIKLYWTPGLSLSSTLGCLLF